MMSDLQEFRCPLCNRLQCRVTPDSVVERKCKCKAKIVYDKGEVRVLSPKEG